MARSRRPFARQAGCHLPEQVVFLLDRHGYGTIHTFPVSNS
jgi:hypothetical protein